MYWPQWHTLFIAFCIASVLTGGLGLVVHAGSLIPYTVDAQLASTFSGLTAPQDTHAAHGGATPVVPAVLRIPALDVEARVQHVGLHPSGRMAVPSNYSDVAWYKSGALPGEYGSAVIAGHLDDSLGFQAVFARLGDLSVGDLVYVEDVFGNERVFRVKTKAVYSTDFAPVDKIFNDTSGQHLTLITCDGAWDSGKKSYERRLVVYTEAL
ncbi:sortase [Candidatus Kaiserbacteria bacterium CG10_big_fil_rev_8_21_14_0_10_49_17]|uniref:Sortase n=1 Tax=Candidatus Kaiserbacteria bacterium CG10_big_fil_rev_8_21_14_0_10_49_17 TaxID=1974609 RepID=A0A2M6WEQ9_9BACT|nr:MAG: sortase [Candidatus Kaiserbacteria bacterium CG10_big_fil_rev_8_21_14_0_10_49_17]